MCGAVVDGGCVFPNGTSNRRRVKRSAQGAAVAAVEEIGQQEI